MPPVPDRASRTRPAAKHVWRGRLAREAESNAAAKLEPLAAQQNVSNVSLENVTEGVTGEPAAERRKNAAHSASCGSTAENDPAPKERKNPERELQEKDLQRLQAAIEGAERGNWRDLRIVFEFVGIGPQLKDAPS